MRRVIIGFLPWILYFLLIGNKQSHIDLAISVAFATLVITGFRDLLKGFILT